MRYQLQTLALIIQLRVDHCYTFVSAARLGDRSRIERQRRSLRSLSQNHSFAGYHRRRREGEEHYRERLRREYGSLGDFILIEKRMGRNKRAYTAYSGAIFKIAVGEEALLHAYRALCYLMLAPGDVASGAAPFLADPDARAQVLRLLDDHRKHVGVGGDKQRASWFVRIPHGAFGVAMDWGTGCRQHLPSHGPPASIRKALLARVLEATYRRAALRVYGNREKTRDVVELVATTKENRQLMCLTRIKQPRSGSMEVVKTENVSLAPAESLLPCLSSDVSPRPWSWPRRLACVVALVLMALPMTHKVVNEPDIVSSRPQSTGRIMPLYTQLDIEVEQVQPSPSNPEVQIPELVSPEHLEIYFIPDP